MNSMNRKNIKGTALFTVVCVMAMLSLLLVAMFSMLAVAQKKAQMSYYNSQGYTSAKTVTEIYTTYLTANPGTPGDPTDPGDPCITGPNGIGATAQEDLRDQLKNLPVDIGTWKVISTDALAAGDAPGMGKVKLEVKKENSSSYLIRATAIKESSVGSEEKVDAVVTKRITCVADVKPALFDNSVTTIGGADLGKANSLMLGGVVSLTNAGTITGGAGIGSVGDFYSAHDVKLIQSGYSLSQNINIDDNVSPALVTYDVDTMEVKGNLTFDTGSGQISVFNDVDTSLGTPADWSKGQTPYIFVDGDFSFTGNGGDLNIGCYQIDTLRFASHPDTGYISPPVNTTSVPVDIYVNGNVTLNSTHKLNHSGTIYYTGSFSDTGNSYNNISGTPKQHVTSLAKTLTPHNLADYPPVNSLSGGTDFMTNPVTVNGTNTTPMAMYTNAMATATTLAYSYTGAPITTSARLTGGLDGELTIDTSLLRKSNGDSDLWIDLVPNGSNKVNFNFCKININNGSVPVGDRVNVYFYSQNADIDFNGCFIGLDERLDNNPDYNQTTQAVTATDYKGRSHYYGSTADQINRETPSNVYFICDRGSMLFENGSLIKGYIYAPDTAININNGCSDLTSYYNKANYTYTTRESSVVGAIIGNVLGGSVNDTTITYVKPYGSILSKAATSDPVWRDPGIFNNH